MRNPNDTDDTDDTDGALLGALAAAIRAPEFGGDLEAFLLDHAPSLSEAQRRGLMSRGAPRLAAYRQLVHNRIRNVVRDWIPRTAHRIGDERLARDVGEFITERGAHAPYLRDVPAEFVAWVCPQWTQDPTLPPFLPDLARYELLRNDVRNDPRGGERDTGLALALESQVRLDTTARVLRFAHAVHKLPRDPEDRSEPEVGPVDLLVFRNRREVMMYRELDATEAAMVRRLMAGQCMRDAIVGGCADANTAVDDARLAELAKLLARLTELGVVLGAQLPATSA